MLSIFTLHFLIKLIFTFLQNLKLTQNNNNDDNKPLKQPVDSLNNVPNYYTINFKFPLSKITIYHKSDNTFPAM